MPPKTTPHRDTGVGPKVRHVVPTPGGGGREVTETALNYED